MMPRASGRQPWALSRPSRMLTAVTLAQSLATMREHRRLVLAEIAGKLPQAMG